MAGRKPLWEWYCSTGLGKFLQRLTTGEGAAMNACVGVTAFSLAFYKHLQEEQDWSKLQKREKFERHFQHVTDHIYDTEPLILLSNIEQYSNHLRVGAEAKLNVSLPTRAELADEVSRE